MGDETYNPEKETRMNLHSLARTTPISRALLIDRVTQQAWSVSEAAEAAGISQRSAYKWLARYRSEGATGLLDRSSRPQRSPFQIPSDWRDLILKLRRSRKTGPEIADKLGIPRSTVARILRRAGLHRLKLLEPREPVIRYERKRPGELIHLDIKKLARIAGRIGHRIHGDRSTRVSGAGWEFAHVAIDDHSRLAYVEVLANEKGVTATGFFERALAFFRRHGIRVERVLTDNGACYRSHAFLLACAKHEIRAIKTRPYRPQTNGKAERFIQTLIREWAYVRPYKDSKLRTKALKPWLRYYNRQRPHGSLCRRPPISRVRPKDEQRA